MFRKSRIKTVASIMIIMTLLLAGTFGIIYVSSYREMSEKDEHTLERYAQVYSESGNPAKVDENGEKQDSPPPKPDDERAFEVAAKYSVAFDSDGKVKDIDNSSSSLYNDDLTALAKSVKDNKERTGKIDGYTYLVDKQSDYTLVVFLDRSDFDKNVITLFKYTIIFGVCSLVVVFILSLVLSKYIIRPLERSHNMQKRFISDAGHELKTPVTVISTNAEVLSSEIGENRWLDNIVYENERMSILIKQLMALAKTDKAETKLEKTDLSRVVIGEILPFESVAFEKGIEINYDEVEDEVFVNGSSPQLSQLVSILIDNAIEHSTGGDVSVSLKHTRGKAELKVVNNGEKIPEEKRKLLFDRFYRLNEARNDDGGNHYGLGLSIAKSIADAHNGEITVDCKDGKVIFGVILKTV